MVNSETQFVATLFPRWMWMFTWVSYNVSFWFQHHILLAHSALHIYLILCTQYCKNYGVIRFRVIDLVIASDSITFDYDIMLGTSCLPNCLLINYEYNQRTRDS